MPSKIDVINRAAARLKISGITVSLNGNEVQEWLYYLDDYMATIASNEYPDIGYLQPDNYGGSDANDESGLERWMVKPVSTLLADDISGSYGSLGVITPREAIKAHDDLASGLTRIDPAKFAITMPIGQANEYPYRFSSFYRGNNPQEPIVRPTISIGFGEVADYPVDLRSYLDGATINSYEITTSPGLTVISSAEDSGEIIMRLECGLNVAAKQTVSVFVKTSDDRQRYFIINVKALHNLNNETNI